MRITPVLLALCSVLSAAFSAPPRMDVNANGMIQGLLDWPSEIDCRAGVWIVRDNWKSVHQQWDLKELRHSPFDSKRTIDGTFPFDSGNLALHQQIDADTLSYELRSEAALDVTGVYWFIELPVETFSGGTVMLGSKSVTLSEVKPQTAALGEGTAQTIEIRSKDSSRRVEVRFPEGRQVRVQDARVFGDTRYQIYTPLTESPLAAGAKLSFSATIRTTLPRDSVDATITIDPKSIRNEFDGFGGNFVYQIDDPTTQIALDALKLTWARVGIEAAKWEPTNDDDDPMHTDDVALAAHDVPGSALRKRFELDQRLYKLAGGRVIASLWHPPEWLFAQPLTERNVGGTIPRERWDELAECVTSYLLHLKTHYGVVPALFSFNESDIGIYLLLSGEEMRDMTKLLGKRFGEVGLRTKILLGDSADLKKGFEQIQPTLDDPAAMKFVGALAYHPWAGQNEHWKAWSEAAEKHGLMLMAAEMGADAAAWQDDSFNSPLATLHLARKYIEQLRDAKTQVMLEWEWTGDYAMTTQGKSGAPELSNRGRFLRQLTQTTPTQASIVEAKCDAASIVAAAVLADDQKSGAIHLVNTGGDRKIRLRGLPASLTLATLFVIDPLTGERTPAHVEAKDGVCAFDVPAGAIATLAFPTIH